MRTVTRQKTVKRVKTFTIVSTTSPEVPFELQEMQSLAAGAPSEHVYGVGKCSAQTTPFVYTYIAAFIATAATATRCCSCCPLRCTVYIQCRVLPEHQCVSIRSLSCCSLNIHVVCNVEWVPASVFCLCTVGDGDEEMSFSLNRHPSLVSFWRRISAQFDLVAVVVSVFLFFIVLFVFAVVET